MFCPTPKRFRFIWLISVTHTSRTLHVLSEYITPTQFPFFLFFYCFICICLCVCDGNLNLYTRLDADGGDLLNDLRWAVQIDQALVDPHLETIPGFGTFTTGSLPGGDAQSLEGEQREYSLTQK